MSWINDGLERKFGTERTAINPLGEYKFLGPQRIIAIDFSYTDLPAVASNSVIINDNLSLPKGAVVEKVEIFCPVDFDSSGDSMTLNVGWVDTDRTNGLDVDALVVAATQAELITGGENVAGWVGAEVGGVPTTTVKILTWEVDSQAATAGKGSIRIFYSVPV